MTLMANEHLKALKIAHLVHIRDLNFDFLPLEKDVFSLQMEDSFKRFKLNRDNSVFK